MTPRIPNSKPKHDPYQGVRMETCQEVAARYKVSGTTLSKRLRKFQGEFPARYGESGRNLMELHVTPDLDAMMRRLNGWQDGKDHS